MIYFLPVLQFLFLLITVSSKECHDRNVIQVITGGRKESSENGNYYGIISTPNFPQPFRTPFRQTWVIDASDRSDGTQINLYLTQMYLSSGVRIFQHPTLDYCDHNHRRTNKKPGPRQECRKPEDQHADEFVFNKLHDVVRLSTTCPYLEIEVNVPKLYGYHYRTRDPFLFDVYGFNITYEIVPETVGLNNYSCHIRNCSSLGHCYLGQNWRDFYCDCVKDQRGQYCEISSQHCDPENNITFCSNGGKCKVVGSGDGFCNCEGTGYTGAKCEIPIKEEHQPKVSARTGTSPSKRCSSREQCPLQDLKEGCDLDHTPAPCSCRPNPRSGRSIPSDWVKYEAAISISPNFTTLRNRSRIEMEMQRNVRNWLESNGLSVLQNVFVRFHPPREEFPVRVEELLIHFHGPVGLQDEVNSTLNKWRYDRSTLSFWRLIPLAENSTFVIYTMPRVKYKSIEVSKPNTTLEIGYGVSFTCTAITGRSKYFAKSDIRFRWFKDGMMVNKSLSTSRHITIGRQPLNDNETVSILIIDQVSQYDGGLYTCEITDLEFGDQDCGQHQVDVILPPVIEVNPMSLTLEKRKLDKGVVITCTDGSKKRVYDLHNTSVDMVWFKGESRKKDLVRDDDFVVLEDIIPQGKLLRILKAEHSQSFTCTGYNKRGGERSKEVKVNVLDSTNAPSCKRHWERLIKQDKDSSLLWEWTAPKSWAKIPCPKNYLGWVQRECILTSDGKAYWGSSDFSRCISQYLAKLNKTLQNAKRGFGDYRLADPVVLMTRIEEYLDSNNILFAGEGERIIALVGDIVQYAFDRAKVDHGKLSDADVSSLFPIFFTTIVKLLKRPNSCVQNASVHTLCNLAVQMAVRGAMQATTADSSKSKLLAHIEISDVLMLQTLPISAEAKYRDLPYIFPERERMTDPNLSWLKDKIRVIFPLDSEGFRRDAHSPLMHYLVMAAYKNLSSLLVPSDAPGVVGMGTLSKSNIRTSIELISPIVQIAIPEDYYLPQQSHIKILFNLSKEHKSSFLSSRSPLLPVMPFKVKSTFFSCGALDNTTSSTKMDYQRMQWTMNACQMDIRRDGLVECQCENLGIFGLLNVSHLEEEIPVENNDIHRIVIVGFSFCILSCVLSATVLCIYLKCRKCRISMNSLYALKLFDCVFIFSAVSIVLLGRTEMPSASWLVWSTTACSFLISSVNVQVTKALRVLLMEAKPDLPMILPWLRHVSQVTLLSAITFSTVLPLWTAAVARIIGANNSNESAFDETSHVFAVFVAIVGLDCLVFLGIYYKAVLKTKRELNGCQQHCQTTVVPTNFTMEMIWILKYRMKTLNRSLCLALMVLVLTLAIILHENLRHSTMISFSVGFAAIMMGMVIFLSYVTHCEYPLCEKLWSQKASEKPLLRDPEIENVREKDGSRRKLYSISSDARGNGSVVGGLLPPPQPILRNSMRHFGEESETLSVSTVEEQSMDTFSTEVSYRQSSTSTQTHTQKFHPGNMNSRRKSLRSVGSNTMSSSGGSSSGKQVPALRKVPCLILRDNKDAGEYIMPSVHCNNGTGGNFNNPERSNGSATQIPQVEATSIGSTGSYNSYLPINEHDDLQKISQGLKLILSDK